MNERIAVKHSRKFGSGSGGVDAVGILDSRWLPDPDFLGIWDDIIVDEEVKDRLLGHAILNFTLRPRVSRSGLPLHGLIVLVGPPGTGKTSLARGLAAKTAEVFDGQEFLFVEVEPHALASAALGKSQKAVRDLLGSTVAELAQQNNLIVLLDEVETLAADRSRMSLEANPIDVHRATDAVLAQLDHLSAAYPNTLFIATSNFAAAIDSALLSRADLVITVDNPSKDACRRILTSAVEALAKVHPKVKSLLRAHEFEEAVKEAVGLDGRAIRKAIVAACAMERSVALEPARVTAGHVLEAIRAAKRELDGIARRRNS